jgi:hypothetical protein
LITIEESFLRLLSLSTRSKNALLRSGVNNQSQFLALTEVDLQKIRNLGSKSIKQILYLQSELRKQDNNLDSQSNQTARERSIQKMTIRSDLATKTNALSVHNAKWELSAEDRALYSKYDALFRDCSSNRLSLDRHTISILEQRPTPYETNQSEMTIFECSQKLISSASFSSKFGRRFGQIQEFFLRYGVFPNTIGLLLGTTLGEPETREHFRHLMFALFGNRNGRVICGRLDGKTLQEISEETNLTRERVRQIVSGMGPGAKATIDWINSKRNDLIKQLSDAYYDRTQKRISELIAQRGAVYLSELVADFGENEKTVLSFFPKHFRKLIIHESKPVMSEPQWSRLEVLGCIQKAGTYYFPLSAAKYQYLVTIGEVDGPSVSYITMWFGPWSRICMEAGVEAAAARRETYERMWTTGEIVHFLMRYFLDQSTDGTVQDYSIWASRQIDRIPSVATIQNVFGNWSSAKLEALKLIRAARCQE